VTLTNELRRAIQQGELELRYQPQVELSGQTIVGVEALVRWNHPRKGLLPAGAFIPIAERGGLTVELGNWVLERACRQMRQWRDAGLSVPLLAINVSLAQLQSSQELLHEVIAATARWGLAPADLEFDVTEATLSQLKWSGNEVLPQLRDLGVKIAIDNFGSEYSSFDYVRAYRINHLKLGRAFINRSCLERGGVATISAIINFAREVGVSVIAQGVETEAQRALVASADAEVQAQGFHFSDAVTAEEAAELLRRGRIQASDTGATARLRQLAMRR